MHNCRQVLCARPAAAAAGGRGGSAAGSSSGRYAPQHPGALPPPKALMREKQTAFRRMPKMADNQFAAGDSFGNFEQRRVAWEPSSRMQLPGELGELFGPDSHPEDCINPRAVHAMCGRFGLTAREAVAVLRDNACDVNAAIHALERGGKKVARGSYGLVALEKYSPECFCAIRFVCPSFESTRDEEVLDALHEIALSAAEIPLDTPTKDVYDVLLSEWEADDGTPISTILRDYDVSVAEVLLLPFGDYSCHGFHIAHALADAGFPNIGTGVSATCLDLRTGIHNRFRFDLERLCDTISEHCNYELLHFGQDAHILRQPFWWNPEYSIEELLRFKESSQRPSASIFEMRYLLMQHGFGHAAFRNVVELDKLRVVQHKFEKDTNEQFESETRLSMGQLRGMAMAAGIQNREEHAQDDMSGHAAISRRHMTAYGISDKFVDREITRFYKDNKY